MIIIIDGDELAYKSSCPSVCYQAGWNIYKTKKKAVEAGEGEVVQILTQPHPDTVKAQLENMVGKIRRRCGEQFSLEPSFSIVVVLSGSKNFRMDKYPDYKANRIGRERPLYLGMARQHLKNKFITQESVGQEGDDLCGILSGEDTVVCSSDKDFLTLPGWLYNIMQDKFILISEHRSWINFYTQIMVGDTADNVQGLPGVGPVKAGKILEGLETKQEMLKAVIEAFWAKGLSEGDVEKAGFLLYIRQKPGEIWSIDSVLRGDI